MQNVQSERGGSQGPATPGGALRDAQTIRLPSSEAIREELRLLASLTPVRELSLWALADGRVRCLAAVRGRPSSGIRGVAARAATGSGTSAGPRRSLIAHPVRLDSRTVGALAGRVPAGSAAAALGLFAEAEPLLACVLERQALLDVTENQAAVIMAAERRVSRFGFDLHDGPAQEIAALLSDLRMFGDQLRTRLADHPDAEAFAGRIGDLESRTLALDAEIRDMARSAGGSVTLDDSVVDAVQAEVRAFAEAVGVTPRLEASGPIDDATLSQRITLLRGIQEALRNVRRHAHAGSVSIRIAALPGRLEAEVKDDGRGFDVRRALARGRREGRFGVASIGERARLLGGDCTIESRPGGPTTVRISLPRWASR